MEPIKNEYAKDTSSRSRQCIRERSSTGRSSGRGATRSIGAADVRTDRLVLTLSFVCLEFSRRLRFMRRSQDWSYMRFSRRARPIRSS